MSFVVDNSVVMAWCFEDEQTPAILALLDRVSADGAVVPQLWPIEAANVLLAAQRRGRLSEARRSRIVGFLLGLPITIDGETNSQLWSGTLLLANSFGLSVYDAVYLELAIRRGLPLATLDRALAKAARTSGVECLI